MLRRQAQTLETATIPAPVGGINTVAPGAQLPDLDCIWAYNLFPCENGLRARLGYSEYVNNGFTGDVRSIFAFQGNDAGDDALFATDSTGIFNITAGGTGTLRMAFTSNGPRAGYGSSFMVSTSGGRFLVYCDEENGAYLYSPTLDWGPFSLSTNAAWEPLTTYAVGNRVTNAGNLYECITAGESDSSGGPTTTASDITDGSAHWEYLQGFVGSTVGPSLADQNLGYSGDPANFVFGCVWKSRVWFVEKNTTRAWYLDIDAIFGELTSLNFGMKFKEGGDLLGLYNWSYDGGNGLDTLLVGISRGGDVVVYQGTDPSSATTFGLKGFWSLPSIPFGRRVVAETGSDLEILTSRGTVPLSRLVAGLRADDDRLYSSHNVANLFAQLMEAYGTQTGWAVYVHPVDNALVVTHPSTENDGNTDQLVMSLSTKGWFRYRDLPINCAGTFQREFYFGTVDGRVCKHTGYVDDVQLGDPETYDLVEWSLLTAYRNLGSMRQKQIRLIRPLILSGSSSPVVQSTAKYGFNLSEPAAPTGTPSGGWDSDTWDSGVFSDYVANGALVGAAGMGREAAIALRGRASSRTVLVGIDVGFAQGGIL